MDKKTNKNIQSYSRNSRYIVWGTILISLMALIMFFELKTKALSSQGWIYDTKAIQFVNGIRGGILNRVFEMITSTGNPISITLITLSIMGVLFYKKKKRAGIFFAINIIGISIVNEVLKEIFKRTRPEEQWLVNAGGYSFPSGHAMIFMGLSLLLIYYVLFYVRNRKWAISMALGIFIYSVLVGLSRIYVGVHYLSDVLGGWTVGLVWVILVLFPHRVMSSRKRQG